MPEVLHELKIWPEFLEPKLAGVKPWEYRNNDRGYAVGQLVLFREWDQVLERYTGRAYGPCRITYMLPARHRVIFTHTEQEVPHVPDH